MKKRIGTLLVGALALALPGTATSGQLKDGLAAYQSKDYEMALRLFRPLAVQGDAKAQALLGSMYQIGDGVPQDYAERLMEEIAPSAGVAVYSERPQAFSCERILAWRALKRRAYPVWIFHCHPDGRQVPMSASVPQRGRMRDVT